MTISTETCKIQLSGHFRVYPGLIRDIYGEDPSNEPHRSLFVAQAVKDAQTPAKWKREGKWSAKTYFDQYGGDYRQADGVMAVNYYHRGLLRGLPIVEVKFVRVFTLDPAEYDDAISYRVLEGIDGTLYIGEHTGD